MFEVWKYRKLLNAAAADFHGYWINPISASHPDIKVSWYSWKNPEARSPRLFCIGNTGRKTVRTGIRFDWKKIGIPAPAKLKDLWTGKIFSEKELADFELKGHNFMLVIPVQDKRESSIRTPADTGSGQEKLAWGADRRRQLSPLRLRGKSLAVWSDPIVLMTGPRGYTGRDSFCCVAYASDATGANFSLDHR